jgi:hypothetical protein
VSDDKKNIQMVKTSNETNYKTIIPFSKISMENKPKNEKKQQLK